MVARSASPFAGIDTQSYVFRDEQDCAQSPFALSTYRNSGNDRLAGLETAAMTTTIIVQHGPVTFILY